MQIISFFNKVGFTPTLSQNLIKSPFTVSVGGAGIFIFIPGFWNQGLRLYFVSICIFIIFSMFPSEKIKNERIINIIRQIANHTAGIYYIHIPVYRYTREYIMFIHINSIKGCAIIYLISYLICFVGNKIFGKTKIRNLFE